MDASEIKRGDVICFYSTDPQIYGMPNTHRVVEDPIVTENGIEFVTRGDANRVNDKETAKSERLIGVYVKGLDGLTAFTNAISGRGMFFLIIGLQFCIIPMIVYSVVKEKRKQSTDNDEEKEN